MLAIHEHATLKFYVVQAIATSACVLAIASSCELCCQATALIKAKIDHFCSNAVYIRHLNKRKARFGVLNSVDSRYLEVEVPL